MKSLFSYLTVLFIILLLPLYTLSQPVGGGPIGGGGVGGGSVENDVYGAGWNGDTINAPSQNAIYDYLHLLDTDDDGDIDSIDAGALAALGVVFDTGDITGTSAYTTRETSSQAYTASGNISEAQILANKYLTNQGAGAEIDLVLPDLEYYINVTFIINEAFIIEINPPNADTHEEFDLDGTILDESDCIDSPTGLGSKIVATRMQWDDGTWKWSFDTVRGVWVDTGASD